MQEFLQQIINGLSFGAIYALIAVGYTMVYGVLRLINFAHGDVFMMGAMLALIAATQWFAIPLNPPWVHVWQLALLGLLALSAITAGGWWAARRSGRRRVERWTRSLALACLVLLAGGAVAYMARPLFRVGASPSWLSFAGVLIASMAMCGALGFVIERIAYRPLRNQPRIASLITAIGVSMFLEFGGQWAFGASPQAFPTRIMPPLMPGSPQRPVTFTGIAARPSDRSCAVLYLGNRAVLGGRLQADCTIKGGVSISAVDLLIFLITAVLMLLLWWIVMKTRTGMALRAVSFRFDTASLMGINVNRIISFTFVLGSALAAVAGVLVSIRSPKVDPLMGLMPGIKAFVAAVLGGIGNVPGAVLGGFVLGITEVLVATQGSQYRDGVAFVILILVLLIKPAGLMGQNVVEKV